MVGNRSDERGARRDSRKMRVYVSGLHSGPNPSPGLGVVRSLKAEDPDVEVIGVDYSTSSSGLHAEILDGVVCFPAWPEVDIATWRAAVLGWVHDGATFVPGLDLEIRLLEAEIGRHPRILAPVAAALAAVVKPAVDAAEVLGISWPDHERNVDARTADRFLRQHGGWAWVKGQHYEAFRATSTADALAKGEFVAEVWGGEWHLEAHVPGQECGLAFCARDGRLLDAVFMSKVLLTPDGKTWSGEVHEVEPFLRERLIDFVAATDWTGGGEIEIVRRWDGELVLLEINPRFPAWIHGATVSGANLPAALLHDQLPSSQRRLGPGFTRVLEEVPVSVQLGISSYPWSAGDAIPRATKHPSGMRGLAQRRLVGRMPPAGDGTPSLHADLQGSDPTDASATPCRVFSEQVFSERIEELQKGLASVDEVVLAMSVKTCPYSPFLQLAASHGLVAEAISLDELDFAVGAGHDPDAAILNGPAKWWPRRGEVRCHAFFADSMAELIDLRADIAAGFELKVDVVGVRVAPGLRSSRFGVALERSGDLDAVVAAAGALQQDLDAQWGTHFHHAQSAIGTDAWEAEVDRFLALTTRLSARLGPPAMIDLGGGWHADDLQLIAPALARVRDRCPGGLLDSETRWVLEPGKVLTEPAAVLHTTVLAVDGQEEDRRVVVDAALGDLPEALYRAHPVAHFRDGRWERLRPGRGAVVGRSCMEADVLGRGLDLKDVARDDTLRFEACGAYDAAMAYAFGRGRMAEVGR
jgi:diaminopimelate decarboxylase